MASRGINKVILIGNLGNDPDIRYTADGRPIANLSIATSESWQDKNTGQQIEKTEWHRIVMFGKVAEIASQYLRKGSQVYIEGKLQTRKWQDNQGQDRYTTEIVVDMNGILRMLDRRNSGDTAFTSSGQQGNPSSATGGNQATANFHPGNTNPPSQNNFSQSRMNNNSPNASTPAQNDQYGDMNEMDDDIPF